MPLMKSRIPLLIIEGRLVLTTALVCKKLRLHVPFHEFVIDTGSNFSFLSYKDVLQLQIPMKNRRSMGRIQFGGSDFDKTELPPINLLMLKENKTDHINIKVILGALLTKKTSERKRKIAETLPSILGMDFLSINNFSLHIYPHEKIAYLSQE
ncbi:MAG: hypothetical protein GXP63_05690 [DPANN group archaeon]|nr:hypothetical protein [DPANN group archaeon]